VTQISLPRGSSETGTNEWNDVYSNDNAITTVVNGQLSNDNLDASAAIAHSKLANGTSGQLLVANSSGVITSTTVTGDVTISSTGVTAIGTDKVTATQLKDSVSVDGDRAVTTDHIRDDAVKSAKLDLLTDYQGPSTVTCSDNSAGTLSISSIPEGVYQVFAGVARFSTVATYSLWFSNTGTMTISGPTSSTKSESPGVASGNGPGLAVAAIVTVTATGNLTLNIQPNIGTSVSAFDTYISLFGVKS
jgi:hypothetical protein